MKEWPDSDAVQSLAAGLVGGLVFFAIAIADVYLGPAIPSWIRESMFLVPGAWQWLVVVPVALGSAKLARVFLSDY